MNSEQIWQKIYKLHVIPRADLVLYIKAIRKEVANTPLATLAQKSQTPPPRAFPETLGEKVANDINYALVSQEWINNKTAVDLEELISITSSLEISPDNKNLWQELFEKIDKLQ